jgi:hypothetical protein
MRGPQARDGAAVVGTDPGVLLGWWHSPDKRRCCWLYRHGAATPAFSGQNPDADRPLAARNASGRMRIPKDAVENADEGALDAF